jgi:hypothetical protein
MAIRLLVFAALVSSAFSAHAQTTGTSPLQTYMPRAVEGFFVFTAPTAPVTAPVILADSSLSAAAAPSAALTVQAPPAPSAALTVQAPPAPSATLTVQAPPASVAPATEPAVQLATAPAALKAPPPADASLAEFVSAGASTAIVAKTDIPSDAHAALTGAATIDAALAPTVLLPLALDANGLPEPGTSGLMLAGLAGVGFMARRRRSR